MHKYPYGTNRKNAETIENIAKKGQERLRVQAEKDQICWCGVRPLKDRVL